MDKLVSWATLDTIHTIVHCVSCHHKQSSYHNKTRSEQHIHNRVERCRRAKISYHYRITSVSSPEGCIDTVVSNQTYNTYSSQEVIATTSDCNNSLTLTPSCHHHHHHDHSIKQDRDNPITR